MGIHLRGYAGKNPKQEYKRESFELFQQMLDNVKYDVVKVLARVRIQAEDEIAELEAKRREEQAREKLQMTHQQAASLHDEAEPEDAADNKAEPFVRDGKKIGRNDSCPCGSGKKYKQCHGNLSA